MDEPCFRIVHTIRDGKTRKTSMRVNFGTARQLLDTQYPDNKLDEYVRAGNRCVEYNPLDEMPNDTRVFYLFRWPGPGWDQGYKRNRRNSGLYCPFFHITAVCSTGAAMDLTARQDLRHGDLIQRHLDCDWGDVSSDLAEKQDRKLWCDRPTLVSRFNFRDGVIIVCTEKCRIQAIRWGEVETVFEQSPHLQESEDWQKTLRWHQQMEERASR